MREVANTAFYKYRLLAENNQIPVFDLKISKYCFTAEKSPKKVQIPNTANITNTVLPQENISNTVLPLIKSPNTTSPQPTLYFAAYSSFVKLPPERVYFSATTVRERVSFYCIF